MTGKTSGYYKPNSETVAIWLSGNTLDDLRLLLKIRDAIAEEINERIAYDDWDVEGLIEAGGSIMAFHDEKRKELEDREDAAILQESEA